MFLPVAVEHMELKLSDVYCGDTQSIIAPLLINNVQPLYVGKYKTGSMYIFVQDESKAWFVVLVDPATGTACEFDGDDWRDAGVPPQPVPEATPASPK